MASSDVVTDIVPAGTMVHGPSQADLDKCVHCGLCLNSCPTYRQLGLEMDSPRGRIQSMNAVANGAPISQHYQRHLELCLACRGCETACPSGVPYGRMVEQAKAQIRATVKNESIAARVGAMVCTKLIPSRTALQLAGSLLYGYQRSGLQRAVRRSGILKLNTKLQRLEELSPEAEAPFFFRQTGRTVEARGETRFRVAFLSGCIANVTCARLHEATVRVLQANGCQVSLPAGQTCCGALQLHAGYSAVAETLAVRNIEAVDCEKFDAVITNAAGCGSTLKEYGWILRTSRAHSEKAARFSGKVKDVTEFLHQIGLLQKPGSLSMTVTYQDSCHLKHGQAISDSPRWLLQQIPGLRFEEMAMADLCCGSAGTYNLTEPEMADRILASKMKHVNETSASVVTTANPGCMIQLAAGVRRHGNGQRVAHVIEILDEAYRATGIYS